MLGACLKQNVFKLDVPEHLEGIGIIQELLGPSATVTHTVPYVIRTAVQILCPQIHSPVDHAFSMAEVYPDDNVLKKPPDEKAGREGH